jgi:hypothetical protein
MGGAEQIVLGLAGEELQSGIEGARRWRWAGLAGLRELRDDDELPDAKAEQKYQNGHSENSQPLISCPGALASDAVAANVFGEVGPRGFTGLRQAAGAITGLKPLQPQRFFEAESVDIAADETLSEDAARQFAKVPSLYIEQLPLRELRRGAHRLEGNSAMLPLLP